MNLYKYVSNGPLSLLDPFGMCPPEQPGPLDPLIDLLSILAQVGDILLDAVQKLEDFNNIGLVFIGTVTPNIDVVVGGESYHIGGPTVEINSLNPGQKTRTPGFPINPSIPVNQKGKGYSVTGEVIISGRVYPWVHIDD